MFLSGSVCSRVICCCFHVSLQTMKLNVMNGMKCKFKKNNKTLSVRNTDGSNSCCSYLFFSPTTTDRGVHAGAGAAHPGSTLVPVTYFALQSQNVQNKQESLSLLSLGGDKLRLANHFRMRCYKCAAHWNQPIQRCLTSTNEKTGYTCASYKRINKLRFGIYIHIFPLGLSY